MYHKLEALIPNVTFRHFNTTTSGRRSTAFQVTPQETYCVGEDLVVQVDTFDHLGDRKTYGGDFIRPRLFSGDLGAAVTGVVKDFNNGSYQVHFPLYWAGKVHVHILLFHPSEAVAALWRARLSGQDTAGYEGQFEKLGKNATSHCGFDLDGADGELCEYKDLLDEEAYYCYKAPGFPCESLLNMRVYEFNQFLTNVTEDPKPKCQPGMGSPLPSGYFYRNIWNPTYCNMTSYKTGEDFMRCLQGKKLYLIGDSTLRQFMMHFTEGIKIANYFGYHGRGWSGWDRTLEAINFSKDLYISYKRHGFPLQNPDFYYFKEDLYTSRQIDRCAGGKDTVIIVSLGHHFRHLPVKVFIKRAFNIRRAVERLFIRSPDTKVIIKTENTREMGARPEIQGDFHGYTHYLVLREVFQGVNVGFIDAWDMTVASATAVVHVPGHTFENIMSLAFSFACS
ncbi:hypothetical protein GDO81_024441 [Engystomops pustulosus]|uniref:NXPE C-terminal domain-containing protein n=1 Tax=Engystomops pustulosus TaxID=76066 RepID=A0AAV6ZMV3_ENGPU|nr:hypothetical protein GDO81_024441 [Engystomops pustulosus]